IGHPIQAFVRVLPMEGPGCREPSPLRSRGGGIEGIGHAASIPRVRVSVSLCDSFVLFGRGCEGSALTPPARTKSASPDLRSLRSLPDRAVPPADFLLAPPHPVSPTGRGSCAESAQNPVTEG